MEMAADQRRQRLDFLGRFLHQQKVGPFMLDQRRDMPDGRALVRRRQIPTDDLHEIFREPIP